MHDRLIIFFVGATTCKSVTVALSDSAISNQVETLRKALQRQLSIQLSASGLYQELIKPFEQELATTRHLVIVPSKSLHYLPFNVLQNAGGEYLGLRWSISLAPSAGVWLHCLRRGDGLARPNIRQFKVTAFGNPYLGDSKWDLPFAGREVRSLQRYYPLVNTFLNQRASETMVKQQTLSPLLLFSCHGEYDSRNPLMSALLLAGDKQQDGRLCAYEIMGLDMNAYLTVVSACETGLGTVRSGEEVEGLVRSFVLAGSSAVITSLWKVDDLATAVLIKRLFRYLAEGDSRAEALRKAQQVVFEEINPYPSYWAGFNITGDYR
jgi:CHAT domain-containing protein